MKTRTSRPARIWALTLAILLLLNLAFFAWNAGPLLEQRGISIPFLKHDPPASAQATETPAPTATASPLAPTDTVAPISFFEPGSSAASLRMQGIMLLAMRDGSNIHLFAYHPLYLSLTRLTNQPWDDMMPSISPDGTQVAYASNQSGFWDLYLLDLVSGEQQRLTATPEYEGSPTWSPDSQWIAYERYNGADLDVYLLSLADRGAAPVPLTEDPGMDRSPAWSPKGREIAFVSTRTGEEEIWLARLDRIDDRFVNLSQSSLSLDRYPVWSKDGSRLAWSTERKGDRKVAAWNPAQPDLQAQVIGEGNRATWSPDGAQLFAEVRDPQGVGLAAYDTNTTRLSMPLITLPGSVYGMTWITGPLVGWLADRVENPDQSPSPPLWQPALTRTVAPAGRKGLVSLGDVTAPQALLQDEVDEAFTALRQQVAEETGWDALSSLENAYVPLTTPLTPSIQNDWLYTGRAFAVNPLLQTAGWLVISKEEFSGQVYWNVYLKARYQDGSMGMPLSEMTWDIQARYSGDPQAYEQGGKPGQTPVGYWVDLTELARRYDWERLPSWTNWKTFYPSIRFNQFVLTGGLDWSQAMAEMYPVEALNTPTSVPTVTLTPTETPQPTPTPVTPTPTPTSTPTRTVTATATQTVSSPSTQ